MKSVKIIALSTLAAASLIGVAFAADPAPAAPKSAANAKCEKEGKDKKMEGKALADYIKKCEADANAKKK